MSARTRLRARLIAATCAVTTLLAVALPSAYLPAQAADLRAFEAGYIISDALFYDSGTMSAATIQSFLTSKAISCLPTSGRACLKDFRMTTETRAADTYCPQTYPGTANETAAQIIVKVAVSCRVNPQVLIVLLQKEQGLVTAPTGGRTAVEYRSATGYGCPDTAQCDAVYYGFFNQLYSAAHQFQYYTKNPLGFSHRVGLVNQVRYNPNAACGSSGVLIQNQATVNLYNYTPYQPNARALAAGYGTGDACSAYGNRNFWNYFTDWFGPTTQRAPLGHLDGVSTTSPDLISVRGWALDPDTTTSISVHVYVDGRFTASLAATAPRADVGRLYRRGDNHGFSGAVKASGGTHQVCVYAIDSAGGSNPRFGCQTVTVINHAPIGYLDGVASSEGRILTRGWALDPDTTSPIRVHIYVDGLATQSLIANTPRTDVGRIYGKGDDHGFTGNVGASAGTHQVCMYGIDSSGGPNPLIGCKNVVVTNKAPIGHLDWVAPGVQSLTVKGWALDPDTTSPIDVDIYVDGKATQSVTANTPRADVGRIYGDGDNHGFTGTVGASAGTHQVCLYAIDSWGATHPLISCTSVTVS